MIAHQPSVAVVAVLAIAGSIAVAAIDSRCDASCDRPMTFCEDCLIDSMDGGCGPADAEYGPGSV